MSKRTWMVVVPGWAPFQMVSLEDGPSIKNRHVAQHA